MTTNTKSRNARRKKTGNESRRERGTHRERDEYGEYKLSRKEQKKIKKAKRKRKLIAMLAVEFVLILVLGVCVFGLSKIGKLQNLGVDPDEVGQNEDMDANTAELLKGYTNIALFGLGSRTPGSLGEGELSDTIIIASINNETKEVRLMSVYRDTYLNRADDTYGKCNAAYSKGGPKQAMEMLNTNLDLNIKYYVSIDFTALIKTVDLLGGVEIDVKEEEIDAINGYMYETTEIAEKAEDDSINPYNDFITEPGLQTLYGVQATAYCRIRKVGNNDFERTERQRRVIEQIVEKAKSAGLGTINSIIDEVFPLIATNIPQTTLIGMAASMMSYELGESSGFPSYRSDARMDGQQVVVPADLVANVTELHKFLFDEDDYYPSPTVLEINDKIIADTGVTAQETDSSSE
ncbi:LCP family protein [Lachnoclostridium sp. An138]|uniref:LCP family protein n=1 Tax=Lachnoclostridium sp. An138 TaxID=1965560 RepID=UPI0013A61537|nr:LCP family protein [Lachnoclostridium sp. An138]